MAAGGPVVRRGGVLAARSSAVSGNGGDASEPAPVGLPPKLGRNDPCPCGSGKKYKKCHGQ